MKLIFLFSFIFINIIFASFDYFNTIQLRIIPTDPKKKDDVYYIICDNPISIENTTFTLTKIVCENDTYDQNGNCIKYAPNDMIFFMTIIYKTNETENKKTLINQLNENKQYIDKYSKINQNDLNNATRSKISEYNAINILLQQEISILPNEIKEYVALKFKLAAIGPPYSLCFVYKTPSLGSETPYQNAAYGNIYDWSIYGKRRLLNKNYYVEIFD